MIKIFFLLGLSVQAFVAQPTNIFCKSGDYRKPVQLFCGNSWVELSEVPMVEARIEACNRIQRGGVLILKVNGVRVEAKNPSYPYRVTLDGVEITCDSL